MLGTNFVGLCPFIQLISRRAKNYRPLPNRSHGFSAQQKYQSHHRSNPGKEDEEQETEEQQLVTPVEPLKSPILASKGKSKNDRATRKGENRVSHKRRHINHNFERSSKENWAYDFVVEGRPVDKEDFVMKNKDSHGGLVTDAVGKSLLLPKDMASRQENNSKCLIENLKLHSVLSIQGIFEVSSRLLETKRLLRKALRENVLLKELEKMASTQIQAAESNHKSAETRLKSAEHVTRVAVKKAEEEAQAYYDQGFDEARINDASNLYNKGRMLQPYRVAPSKEAEETPNKGNDVLQNLEDVQVEDVNEEENEDDEVVDVTNYVTNANI
uniref:Uncharacterized protein n=1 Tax=Fagus sylvatica TaxID=28930 RepID=A0A2N9HDP4_FAGSY